MSSKCRACATTQVHVYPRGIYYYKEQGYDYQQVPAVQGLMDEKSLSPLFPEGVGEGGQWFQMTGALADLHYSSIFEFPENRTFWFC